MQHPDEPLSVRIRVAQAKQIPRSDLRRLNRFTVPVQDGDRPSLRARPYFHSCGAGLCKVGFDCRP